MKFRVYSERHKYGWDAFGVVLYNSLDHGGAMVLTEFGRKTYTIPFRYFANRLVFIHDKNGDMIYDD